MMDLKKLTIKIAKEGLVGKSFSSEELTKEYFTKIKSEDSKINAFLTLNEEGALKQAKAADDLIAAGQNLPLLGIPIAIKDIFVTKDLRTTAGSKVLEDYIPQYDATVVAKLKDAGAIILGKTNMDAWAHGSSGENSDFEPTKNPYNIEFVPGGSSSGSAAAIAADFALASTGTDTGGSIRLPASFTNSVGLKPTYGRVSRYGVIAMASSLDSIGHFTKTVEDSAMFLSITAGKDPKDGTTPNENVPNYLENLNKGVKGLRIGIVKEYLEGVEGEVAKLFEEVKNILQKLGAEIVEVSLPHSEYAIATYYILQPAEVSSNLGRFDGIRYGNLRESFGDEAKRRIMLGTFTLSVGYYDAYYKKAMKVRTLIIQDFGKAFEKVDAIISPVSPTFPWKFGEKVSDPLAMYLSDMFTVTGNLAGIPGLSVPAGFSKNGLPFGMQILGKKFSENILFQIGNAYEKETEYWKRRPNG